MQQKGWEKDLIQEEGPDPGHCDPRAPQCCAGSSRDGISLHIHGEKNSSETQRRSPRASRMKPGLVSVGKSCALKG